MIATVANISNKLSTLTNFSSFAIFLPIKKNTNPKKANKVNTTIRLLIICESIFETISIIASGADIIGISSNATANAFLFILKSSFKRP